LSDADSAVRRLTSPFEVAVVVLRDVQPARRHQIDRRIFEQRSRGEQPLLDRKLVQERFQRRAGLTRRAYAIDIAGAGRLALIADVGEHLAARIVHDQRRGVGDVLACQRGELPIHRLQHERLQLAVERGLHRSRSARQQRAADVRRERNRRTQVRHADNALAATVSSPSHGSGGSIDFCQHARPLDDNLGRGIGTTQQHRQDQRFALVESARMLCRKSAAARRVRTLDLTAERRKIQVSFEDLPLAPSAFELARRAHLLPFLPNVRCCLRALSSRSSIAATCIESVLAPRGLDENKLSSAASRQRSQSTPP
jgi:hypothetical protein